MPDVPFTPQQKAFIISLFGIEASSASTSAPPTSPTPTLATPTSMQTKITSNNE